jgi:hypothetical protein
LPTQLIASAAASISVDHPKLQNTAFNFIGTTNGIVLIQSTQIYRCVATVRERRQKVFEKTAKSMKAAKLSEAKVQDIGSPA